MPVTLSERRGQKAWKECRNLRIIASFFELLVVLTPILWIWFPIPELDWKIFSQWWIGLIVGSFITIPGGIILYKGVKDAGKETLSPSKDTKMYSGIYKFIRHPQIAGAMPMFPALGLALNSWFLFTLFLVYIILYMPIMKHFEEKDLVKRFGDSYIQYQKTTRAYFPKWSVFKTQIRKKRK